MPRDRLGEVAYRALWWAIVVLPGSVFLLRAATTEPAGIFFLYTVIAFPATVALQVIAGLLAWSYRRQQWRHFLGRRSATLSFIYYGLWLLLALTLPESAPGRDLPSLVGRIFGSGFAEVLSGLIIVALPLTYVALLALIVVEGRRAVSAWASAQPPTRSG
ncbi:hypothetical protein G7085_17305 [Tessaracoccus sp. HDW20]|uniref:hypothetical protein n=1 Tax=Tessaracoccus coleopterorum TaxID=2714950 RepID=UPI0018D4371C|nr:hypothetical protein [Tessaracoccus coleopterorum]NHB85748.1 hypothetical protein [Tessaracoccus coleopterorum]